MRFRKVPLWKIKRELLRIWRQLTVDLPRWFRGEYRYLRYRYAKHDLRITPGQIEARNCMALFLIFPVHGVQRSHEYLLEYLHDKGFATLVVSNLPLKDADRNRLAPRAFRIIERQNFGYDFGGYQDGMLQLAPMLPKLDELMIVNDSTWFPVGDGADWIDRARKMGVDFVGPIDATGSAERYEIFEHAKARWDWSRKRHNYHMSSFILWFGRDLLRDRRFMNFWRKLRVSSDKTQTVRRGEIGLSRFVRKAGYSLAPIVDLKDFPDQIARLDTAQMREVFEGLLVDLPERHLRFIRQHLESYDGSEEWRRTSLQMMTALATKGHMAYMSPLLILRYMEGRFLKKALVPKTRHTADVVVKLVDDYPEYFPPDIADEVRETIRRTHRG